MTEKAKPEYWLLKSEPTTYSFDRLQTEKKAVWDGVRNVEARSNLRKMSIGDICFFYHSNEGKAVVGLAKVTREAFQDPTTKDDWSAVEISPIAPMQAEVTLAQMKADPKLAQMAVVRRSRLSVSPVTAAEFAHVMSLGKTKLPK
jgi:predicted RNA-binding protein with PUA-like domain